MNIKYGVTICLLLCIAFCQSCKKGCTNPTAYNYVQSAKVDDASCLYCDSTLITGSSNSISLTDNNSSSIFFEQNVALLIVSTNFVQYNGNGCILHGHTNTANSDSVATYYTGVLQNQTSKTMTFSAVIEVITFGNIGETFQNYNIYNINVPPGSFTNFNIGFGGLQSEFNSFNIQVLSSTFTYH